MKIQDLCPQIDKGAIEIEYISGQVYKDGFLLFVGTDAKYADAVCMAEGSSWVEIIIFPDERTRRPQTRTHYQLNPAPKSTILRLKGDWCAEISRGRHSFRILGVRNSSQHEHWSPNEQANSNSQES